MWSIGKEFFEEDVETHGDKCAKQTDAKKPLDDIEEALIEIVASAKL